LSVEQRSHRRMDLMIYVLLKLLLRLNELDVVHSRNFSQAVVGRLRRVPTQFGVGILFLVLKFILVVYVVAFASLRKLLRWCFVALRNIGRV
jgi:hypothetical protein